MEEAVRDGMRWDGMGCDRKTMSSAEKRRPDYYLSHFKLQMTLLLLVQMPALLRHTAD